MTGNFNFEPIWIIDSGATNHVAYRESVFTNFKKPENGIHVSIPNGDNFLIKGIGSVQLPNDVKIDDVMYIPKFKCNLLAVSKITNIRNSFRNLFPKFCFIQDLHSRKLIGIGRCEGGLYNMEGMDERVKIMTINMDTKIWHRRLGHASKNKLQNIRSIGSIVDLEHCDLCAKAKQTWIPFIDISIKSISYFDLIHCDI